MKYLIVAMAALLVIAPTASASPSNAMQPANVYFGQVKSGQHPERVVTVRNPTGSSVTITRFLIAGAGGKKFTLVGSDGTTQASCHVGTTLRPGGSCTIIERVKTTAPEYWQAVVSVWYAGGQFNGGVYAHVVA